MDVRYACYMLHVICYMLAWQLYLISLISQRALTVKRKNDKHGTPTARRMLMTNPLFDRDFDLVTLDLGHTLIWPDYGKLANCMSEYFDMPITASMVCAAEIEFRQSIPAFETQEHTHVPIPKNAYNYYAALVEYCLKQPVCEMEEHFLPFAIEAHRYHVNKNWFMVLGPDAVPSLRLLSKHCRLGVISNAHGTLERDLTALGIRHFFDFVTDSHEEGVCKPHPDIFIRSLERADVKPNRAVHIGDQPTADVGGAISVGMRAILYDAQGIFDEIKIPGVPVFRNLMDATHSLLGEPDFVCPPI